MPASSVTQARAVLDALKWQLANGASVLRTPRARLFPSKGSPLTGRLVMVRQTHIEGGVQQLLDRGLRQRLVARAAPLDPSVALDLRPTVSVTHVTPGVNRRHLQVFAFTPGVLGLVSEDPTDHIAFEAIDAWRAILDQVVRPCLGRQFSADAAERLLVDLGSDLTVAVASLLHELGHHYSAFRVIPTRDARVQLSALLFDALGELEADAVGTMVAGDDVARPVASFNLLYRVLYYLRKGLLANPSSASANDDNDGLAGLYVFARLLAAEALVNADGLLRYNAAAAHAVWSAIANDVLRLGAELVELEPEDQHRAAVDFFARHVPYHGERFYLSETARDFLVRVADVPVRPVVRFLGSD